MKNNLVLKIGMGVLIVAVAGLAVKLAMTKPTVQTNVTETTTTVTVFPTTVTLAPTTQPIAKATTTTKAAIKSKTAPLTIGDTYDGGKVAYILQPGDHGYISSVQHGLIVAPSDQSTSSEWGCYGTTISGADGTAIGTGNQNTIDIMAGCSTAGIAARICGDLVDGGFSDWYLPSKDELNKLYLKQEDIRGFAANYYWSASEGSANYAWGQYFYGGGQPNYGKSYAGYVRCVRGF